MSVHRTRWLKLLVAALAGVLLLTGTTLASPRRPSRHSSARAPAQRNPPSSSSTGRSPTPAAGTPSPVACSATATPSSPSPTRFARPTADAEYLRQFLSTIDGPVVLVGHSYGGAVITNAATGNPT